MNIPVEENTIESREPPPCQYKILLFFFGLGAERLYTHKAMQRQASPEFDI
jgi:hypothetical protein